MAISGPSSYVPTTEEFLAHWASVNTELGAGNELVLQGGVTQANLGTLKDDLVAARAAVQDALNGQEIARAQINTQKRALMDRLEQLRGRLLSTYGDTPYVAALPTVPDFSAAQSKFIDPLSDAVSLWNRMTSAGLVFTLPDAYSVDSFSDAVDELNGYYTAYNDAVQEAKLARAKRNDLQDEIYPILKQYRQAVPSYFSEGSAYISTLPRLTPLPGKTPAAVNASAVWDADESKARITWEASANADLKEYQVRYTPGDDYEEDDEAVVATILPGTPLELLTDAGLTQPGAQSSFKVYVILTTGNEKGSTAMTVERPLE